MEPLAIITMILGVFTSLAYLLQTLKIMHLHESRDIALPTYAILFITAFFWLIYGISIQNTPLIATYIVGTLTTASIVVVYFVYKKTGRLRKSSKSLASRSHKTRRA